MKMSNYELNTLAESVREQGLSQEASMTQLVYDPTSGEFRQIARGSQPVTGEIVTEMTDGERLCLFSCHLSQQR